MSSPAIDWDRFDAALFDLDGVITPTAEVHTRAWTRLFDHFLSTLDPAAVPHGGEVDRSPFTEADYLAYVDGKPRYDGVRSFLRSRRIELPEGDPSDPPGSTTVCALGNRKNDEFNELLAAEGIAPYPGSMRLLDALDRRGDIGQGIVSSSKNARTVLEAAGLGDRFGVVVDGIVAAELGLPGKPSPDTFLLGADRLHATADRTVVFEDAVSGVAAGRAGGFGLVVGVDRGAGAAALCEHGADLVVADLDELVGATR